MGHPEHESREAHQAKVAELGRAYADALLAADEAAAEIAIREAMEAGLHTAQIDDEIIAPALWHVGDLWERGEISVADEHLATEISIRVLALQREAQRVAQTRGEYRVLLAAPPGELHVVALRMIDNLLRNAGYDVAMLGSDVPTEALATLMNRRPPNVVCMTSTMSERGRRRAGHDRRAAAAMAVGRLRHRRRRLGLPGALASGHRRLSPRVRCRGVRGRDDQGRRPELAGARLHAGQRRLSAGLRRDGEDGGGHDEDDHGRAGNRSPRPRRPCLSRPLDPGGDVRGRHEPLDRHRQAAEPRIGVQRHAREGGRLRWCRRPRAWVGSRVEGAAGPRA